MTKSNRLVFTGLHVVAWIIFVGLSIEAGGLIVNFIFNVCNPESVPKLYQKLDLTELYQFSKWTFYRVYSFILTVSILKAILFYVLVMLMHKIDLTKPFSNFVSEQIYKISYYTFAIGIISYLARDTNKRLDLDDHLINKLSYFLNDSQAFILMAAVIYVIATIFKKGVELQNENDLTV